VSELFTVLGAPSREDRALPRADAPPRAHRDLFAHAPASVAWSWCASPASFDVVFKVIRDRFPPPKTVLRDEVLAKYQMVFIHDRAGRLVDAQEFRRLRFPRARFAPELLEELRREAAHTVRADGADLVFDHLYIERRMTR